MEKQKQEKLIKVTKVTEHEDGSADVEIDVSPELELAVAQALRKDQKEVTDEEISEYVQKLIVEAAEKDAKSLDNGGEKE